MENALKRLLEGESPGGPVPDPRKVCSRCWATYRHRWYLNTYKGDKKLCLMCGSVYDADGQYIGRIKSWDETGVLVEEVPV